MTRTFARLPTEKSDSFTGLMGTTISDSKACHSGEASTRSRILTSTYIVSMRSPVS
ncbi:hypothetical protein D9M68_975390 [compost metagenome]